MMRLLIRGAREFLSGIGEVPLWVELSLRHVRLSYRTSKLGMFWSTLPLGAQMLIAGVVYGRLTSAPFAVILPWIAAGLVIWQFITNFVGQSLQLFSQYSYLVKNFDRSYFAYLMAAYAISAVQMLHNLVLLVAVALVVGLRPNIEILWVFPGFVLFTAAVGWLGMTLAVAAVRFPMAPNVVAAFFNLAYVATPILFMPSALHGAAWLTTINPLTHLIAMLREPLLGRALPMTSVLVTLCVAFVGWTVSLLVAGASRDRVAYWV